jgi:hypothetical protein
MRSPERVKADEALTAALEELLRVMDDPNPRPWVLGDYVIVAAQSALDDDENGTLTQYSWINREQSVPHYRAMGLLAYAQAKLVAEALE